MPRTRVTIIVTAVLVILTLAPSVVYRVASESNRIGSGLDCNGHSAISINLRHMICADPIYNLDNGYYVGHDEPSLQFYSTAANSGNNMRWQIALPQQDPTPTQNGASVANFELFSTFWFSLALCDPNSYPLNPCTPDSDSNTVTGPGAAGSGFVELQFYPPGFSPFINQISCDLKNWCAALLTFGFECTFSFRCNPSCTEPDNFAFIQTNGVPTGPPGPGQQTDASFTPDSKTLLMSPGDKLFITIRDTSHGLLTSVSDRTNGKSGFMTASASNGFLHTSITDCSTSPFDWHPEFATASPSNTVPWTVLFANVNFAMEAGHFELGANGDGDSDDAPCFSGPMVAGCLAFATGGDLDFDGTPYLSDWPNGSGNLPSSVVIGAPNGKGVGPMSFAAGSGYSMPYPSLQFETTIAFSESTCHADSGMGCVVPPPGALFYPFYSQASTGKSCTFNFGNDIPGRTTTDFGKDLQYGSPTSKPNLPQFKATFASGPMANPCTP